jgi:hypothetical protein
MIKDRIVLIFGAVFISFLLVSSATAVNNMVDSKQIKGIAYENEIKKEELNIENNEKKDLLFNTIVDILNNKQLNEYLIDNINLKIPKFNHFRSYDYKDIENIYHRGLNIYNSLNEKQINQKNLIINNIINNNDNNNKIILNFIRDNEKIMKDIKKLSNNNNCNECDTPNSGIWFPGQMLVCGIIYMILLSMIPLIIVSEILSQLTNNLLGWGIYILWCIPFITGYFLGCLDFIPIPST